MERKERRAKERRRVNTERRRFNDPNYNGPERRSGWIGDQKKIEGF